jgi:hypothetical protein
MSDAPSPCRRVGARVADPARFEHPLEPSEVEARQQRRDDGHREAAGGERDTGRVIPAIGAIVHDATECPGQDVQEAPMTKRPYVKPALEQLGLLRKLTRFSF